ncbi:hypothetical protein AXG89_32895 (plasmid) [Burkholderia sp. PAMC 26561]|nr:hypothetical protein AXG89_32895 [Burkholderia sp. PAMC 26561]
MDQKFHFFEYFVCQDSRYSPVVENASVRTILSACHEDSSSELPLEVRREPSYEPTVIRTLWKVKSKDPEKVWTMNFTRNKLTPDIVVAHQRKSISTCSAWKRAECKLFKGIETWIQFKARNLHYGAKAQLGLDRRFM